MIGIIAGANFMPAGLEKAEQTKVETRYGDPSDDFLLSPLGGREIAFLPRHGSQRMPPHRINYRANISALKILGASQVIGINSAGSLKREIPPGTVLIPHDFLCPWQILTIHEDRAVHITPALNAELRAVLVRAAAASGIQFRDGGIYIQTMGPRLETKAEVAMIAQFGDVVGMTMAHEATLCQELGLAYASICSVDNYAHGIIDEPLREEEIARRARENAAQIEKGLIRALEMLA
ncbi:MAG: MTAP family purine nucleoside phosphorylase [candidate division NC10 bacterium]|nr:MTAP family purine nucleoside phosphorylase [candidate division NC10 bacterium]